MYIISFILSAVCLGFGIVGLFEYIIFVDFLFICTAILFVGGLIGRYQVMISDDTDKEFKSLKSQLRLSNEKHTNVLEELTSLLKEMREGSEK